MLVLHHLFQQSTFWPSPEGPTWSLSPPEAQNGTSSPTSHAHHPVQLSRLDRAAKNGCQFSLDAKLWLSRAMVEGSAFRIKVVRKEKKKCKLKIST